MSKYCIYIHTNLINNKVYIGKAIYPPEHRGGKEGQNYKNCPRFGSAIIHYGGNNFSHDILEKNLSEKEAIEKEKFYISQYDSTNLDRGYNLTQGGTGGNTHLYGDEKQHNAYRQQCHQENLRRVSETDGITKLSEAQKKRGKKEKEQGIIRNTPRGKIHPKAKKVKCIETQQIFNCCADAAEGLGYDRKKSNYISRVANGIRQTCKGYHWEFINE